MSRQKESFKQVLEKFQSEARKAGVSPDRLLEAFRMTALEDAEDPNTPHELHVDDVVQLAVQLAVRVDPTQPLDQRRNKELLEDLFEQLAAIGVGRTWAGRRGRSTRFTFRANCKELRLGLEAIGVQERAWESARAPDDV